MKILGIIPARYASTRLPGKPLINISGKPMIQRTYEQAAKILDNIVVATDDYRIVDAVNLFGGNVVMTSLKHKSGTDRCAEAEMIYSLKIGKQFSDLISCFNDKNTEIGTLVKRIENNFDVFDINKPKVIFSKNNNAIYFSRSPIPFVRDYDKKLWHKKHIFYKHIGLYGYKSDVLKKITQLNASSLEMAESLEQNRWLENGFKIKIHETKHESISIDTEEDLKNLKKI